MTSPFSPAWQRFFAQPASAFVLLLVAPPPLAACPQLGSRPTRKPAGETPAVQAPRPAAIPPAWLWD